MAGGGGPKMFLECWINYRCFEIYDFYYKEFLNFNYAQQRHESSFPVKSCLLECIYLISSRANRDPPHLPNTRCFKFHISKTISLFITAMAGISFQIFRIIERGYGESFIMPLISSPLHKKKKKKFYQF